MSAMKTVRPRMASPNFAMTAATPLLYSVSCFHKESTVKTSKLETRSMITSTGMVYSHRGTNALFELCAELRTCTA